MPQRSPTVMTVTQQALFIRYCIIDTTAARQRNHCPSQLVSSLAACRRDPDVRVLSLATLWPRSMLSRPIQTQHWKFRSFDSSAKATAWHVDVYTNQSRTCEDVQITVITVLPLWAKSGLISNLRASLGEHTPRPLLPCLRTHTNRSPPNLKCLPPPLTMPAKRGKSDSR